MNKTGIIKDNFGINVKYAENNNYTYENIIILSQNLVNNRGDINLSQSDFSYTNLREVEFQAGPGQAAIQFEGSTFNYSNLIGAKLSGSIFNYSSFAGAKLIKAEIHSKTKLNSCDFYYADLRGSLWKFVGSKGSDVTNSTFEFADIRNVNFENTVGFIGLNSKCEGALVNSYTRFPNVNDRPSNPKLQQTIYIIDDIFSRELNRLSLDKDNANVIVTKLEEHSIDSENLLFDPNEKVRNVGFDSVYSTDGSIKAENMLEHSSGKTYKEIYDAEILDDLDFSNAYLPTMNFKNKSLINANFSNSDLRRSNFKEANLSGANLIGANLVGANLDSTELMNALYDNKTYGLSESNEIAMIYIGEKFDEKLFEAATNNDTNEVKRLVEEFGAKVLYLDNKNDSALTYAIHFSNIDLVKYILSRPEITEHYINAKSKTYNYAPIEGALLIEREGNRIDKELISLLIKKGANLISMNLIGADLSGLNLSGVNADAVNMSGVNLSNTDLSNANLTNANLTNANLRGADLTSADLSGANLVGVNFIGANMKVTNLSGTVYDRSTIGFMNAIGLEDSQIERMKWLGYDLSNFIKLHKSFLIPDSRPVYNNLDEKKVIATFNVNAFSESFITAFAFSDKWAIFKEFHSRQIGFISIENISPMPYHVYDMKYTGEEQRRALALLTHRNIEDVKHPLTYWEQIFYSNPSNWKPNFALIDLSISLSLMHQIKQKEFIIEVEYNPENIKPVKIRFLMDRFRFYTYTYASTLTIFDGLGNKIFTGNNDRYKEPYIFETELKNSEASQITCTIVLTKSNSRGYAAACDNIMKILSSL